MESELKSVSEEEVKVEDRQRFFRPCRWINSPFTHLRGSVEGVVAVVTSALEAEDVCVPVVTVVGGEVESGRLHRHCRIGLVWQSGSDAVICFCMPA